MWLLFSFDERLLIKMLQRRVSCDRFLLLGTFILKLPVKVKVESAPLLVRFTHSSRAERVQRDHLDRRISFEVEAHVSVFWSDSHRPRRRPALLGGENRQRALGGEIRRMLRSALLNTHFPLGRKLLLKGLQLHRVFKKKNKKKVIMVWTNWTKDGMCHHLHLNSANPNHLNVYFLHGKRPNVQPSHF